MNKKQIFSGIIFLFILTFVTTSHSYPIIIDDDAETVQNWLNSFEEPVGCDWYPEIEPIKICNCYRAAINESDKISSVLRSQSIAYEGIYSWEVTANGKRSVYNNHILHRKKILDLDYVGMWRYEFWAYFSDTIQINGEIIPNRGQTGPEASVQISTVELNNGFYKTAVMGIQYLSNRDDLDRYGKWNIWDNGEWSIFTDSYPLEAGKWYHIILEFDLRTNHKKYVKFQVLDNDGKSLITCNEDDLSNFTIADEERDWKEKALHITLECGNQWRANCDINNMPNHTYRINYDNIKLFYTGLDDVIEILKALTNGSAILTNTIEFDVTKNGKVGLEDAIYFMQKLSGCR